MLQKEHWKLTEQWGGQVLVVLVLQAHGYVAGDLLLAVQEEILEQKHLLCIKLAGSS